MEGQPQVIGLPERTHVDKVYPDLKIPKMHHLVPIFLSYRLQNAVSFFNGSL
jgi:hypothetical protein